jgi:hypothetical protein
VSGAPPGPVLDLGPALHREVRAGLPDPHAGPRLLGREIVGNPPPQPDGASLTQKSANVAHASCRFWALTLTPPAALRARGR